MRLPSSCPARMSRSRLLSPTPLRRRALVVAAISLLASACSRLVDSDVVQCSVDQDCTQRGGAFAASACVDHFCQPVKSVECSVNQDCTQRGDKFAGWICVDSTCQAPGPWTCHVSK